MELLEVQLTTAEGQVAVFNFTVERLNDLAPQLHALAKCGLFEVCVREWRGKVWSVIDGEPCGCEECDTDPKPCHECDTIHPDNITNAHWTVCLECAWECGECGQIGDDPHQHQCEESITCDECSAVVFSDWYYTDGDSRAICGKCYATTP